MKKIVLFLIILSMTLSCTTMGKPIEECFVVKDGISEKNFIGIVMNKLSGWEYRLCKSDSIGDICVDGILKNVFNKTIVDMTVDNVHFTGSLEYRTESVLTSNLYISLVGDSDFVVTPQLRHDGDSSDDFTDRRIDGQIKINGSDEIWRMSLLGRSVAAHNVVNRNDAKYMFDIDGKKYTIDITDTFRGKYFVADFDGRQFRGKTQNELVVIKYLLNGEDLSEEDVLVFTVFDIVRLLRSVENKRR